MSLAEKIWAVLDANAPMQLKIEQIAEIIREHARSREKTPPAGPVAEGADADL